MLDSLDQGIPWRRIAIPANNEDLKVEEANMFARYRPVWKLTDFDTNIATQVASFPAFGGYWPLNEDISQAIQFILRESAVQTSGMHTISVAWNVWL